jgi:beta-xylosidase
VSGTFTNPVHRGDFPDPCVVAAADVFYAYGTNDAHANVPVLSSRDLVHWKSEGDALPRLGAWAVPGRTWAPEVFPTPDGGYALYYTARTADGSRQAIGLATAAHPRGPFVDAGTAPLIDDCDEGGSIDAGAYRHSDGTAYLYWKNDGNAVGRPTHLYGQRLSADGSALLGERVELLTNHRPWHGAVIEAPQMIRHDDQLYLFYSGNAFDSDAYAVGYARCDGPLGPCHDARENPILRSSDHAAGPGHSYVVDGPGDTTWILYHAWPPDAIGAIAPGRQLWLDRLDWVDGRPVPAGPTARPQPGPEPALDNGGTAVTHRPTRSGSHSGASPADRRTS